MRKPKVGSRQPGSPTSRLAARSEAGMSFQEATRATRDTHLVELIALPSGGASS